MLTFRIDPDFYGDARRIIQSAEEGAGGSSTGRTRAQNTTPRSECMNTRRAPALFLLFALFFALPTWAKEGHSDDRIIGVWQPARSSFGKDPENYCLVKIDRRFISSREYPNKKKIKFTYEIIAQSEYAIVVKLGGKKEIKDSCNRLTSDTYLRFDEAWYFQCLSEQRNQQKHGVLKACPQKIFSGDGFGLTGYRTKEEAIETSDTPTFWSQYFPYGP